MEIVDARVAAPPRFSVLVALAVLAVVLQATALHAFDFRGAHLSLTTLLVVWTGLRAGVVTGGWLGLIAGLLEDVLGGSGVNVVAMMLVGFAAGLLSNRFFSDALPVVAAAIAGGTILRTAVNYLFLAFAFDERGQLARISHAMVWEVALNCVAGVLALLAMRVIENRFGSRS